MSARIGPKLIHREALLAAIQRLEATKDTTNPDRTCQCPHHKALSTLYAIAKLEP